MNILLSIVLCCFFTLSVLSGNAQTPENTQINNTEESYLKILKHNPKSDYANYGLACYYFAHNDFHKSLKYSKINTERVSEYTSDSYLVYAASLDALGRSREAISTYEQAIKEYPSNYLLPYNMALSCYKYRDYKKAFTALDSTIAISALYTPAHYLKACCLYEQSNAANAALPLLYAIMIDTDSIRATTGLAIVAAILEGKQDKINIPFYNDRLKVNSLDYILNFYCNAKNRSQMLSEAKPIEWSLMIETYINKCNQNPTNDTDFYFQFFRNLQNSKNANAFSWYTMRYIKHTEVDKWYKNNRQNLQIFAAFLEQNLPAK